MSIQVIQKIHLHRHEQSMSNGVKLICEYCDLKAATTVNLNLINDHSNCLTSNIQVKSNWSGVSSSCNSTSSREAVLYRTHAISGSLPGGLPKPADHPFS